MINEMTNAAKDFLDDKVNNSIEFQEDWGKLRDYYTKSLWHQLTLKLDELFRNPVFLAKVDLVKLNESLISEIRHKMNPLLLVELSVPVTEQIMAKNPLKAIELMEEIRDQFTASSKEAKILCNTSIGMIYLKTLRDLIKVRAIIEATQEDLDELDGVSAVHSRFYIMTTRYYQIIGDHAKYYQDGIRYLGCIDVNTLSQEDQRDWAFSVGIAAILGEGVYNFGELLTHDILKSLQGSNNAWLMDLLTAFNHGNLEQLDKLRPNWSTQADFVAAESKLIDKITLLCLVEMVFQRPPSGRSLTFEEISKATRTHIKKVELLLMKAMSLNLIKGRINEVEQQVFLTWLQPRVLDKEQVASICAKLSKWCDSVKDMKDLVEVDTKAILT